jgi:hypothetical protein
MQLKLAISIVIVIWLLGRAIDFIAAKMLLDDERRVLQETIKSKIKWISIVKLWVLIAVLAAILGEVVFGFSSKWPLLICVIIAIICCLLEAMARVNRLQTVETIKVRMIGYLQITQYVILIVFSCLYLGYVLLKGTWA